MMRSSLSSMPQKRGRRHSKPWQKLSWIVIGLISVIILILVGLPFLPELHVLEQMRENRDQLLKQTADMEEANHELRTKIDLLRNDPEYVETVARDTLDLMKPGEVIVRPTPSATPEPAPSPTP